MAFSLPALGAALSQKLPQFRADDMRSGLLQEARQKEQSEEEQRQMMAEAGLRLIPQFAQGNFDINAVLASFPNLKPDKKFQIAQLAQAAQERFSEQQQARGQQAAEAQNTAYERISQAPTPGGADLELDRAIAGTDVGSEGSMRQDMLVATGQAPPTRPPAPPGNDLDLFRRLGAQRDVRKEELGQQRADELASRPGFTLGGTRYDASGKPIVTAPTTAETPPPRFEVLSEATERAERSLIERKITPMQAVESIDRALRANNYTLEEEERERLGREFESFSQPLKNPLSGVAARDVAALTSMSEKATALQDMLANPASRNVLAQYMGSTAGKALQRFLASKGGVGLVGGALNTILPRGLEFHDQPPEVTEFITLLTNLRDEFGRKRTGMRIAEDEQSVFEEIVSSVGMTPEISAQKLAQFSRIVDDNIRIIRSESGNAGPSSVGGLGEGPVDIPSLEASAKRGNKDALDALEKLAETDDEALDAYDRAVTNARP